MLNRPLNNPGQLDLCLILDAPAAPCDALEVIETLRSRVTALGGIGPEAELENPETVMGFVSEQLAAKPESADVLHDLLAFLVEQMTVLIRKKSDTCTKFLPALKYFYDIDAHALKPETKLDEFWKLDVPEVFAHFRANKLELTISEEDEIRARFKKAKERLIRLGRQIAFTDGLIDQIVYRLYGLTAEEIKIVEDSIAC
ncbi:MAG: hypothetical protein ABSG78_13830 [Verrucomicrobiota bacterium]|jgi:hypothetical protein